MDIFNTKKIAILENEAKIYRENNDNLRELNDHLQKELNLAEGLKLKYEVTKMLLEDDPAIDEMLACAHVILENKRKIDKNNKQVVYDHVLAQQQKSSGMMRGSYGYANAHSALGIAGSQNDLAGMGARGQ